ncbi:glycosyltransferase family 1 protein [Actinorugispora endophytica]|nr:glycosyltransferase family 1 protein [Actinorugispora endophytica]
MDAGAVWAQSTTRALAAAGCETTLLLKARSTTDRLVEPLAGVAGVVVRRPYEESLVPDRGPHGLTPEQAVELITRLDGERRFDVVVLRGRRVAAVASHSETLAGRLWTCLADIPSGVADLTSSTVAELTDIALASRFLLCPSEELRGFLESAVPAACGRSVLLPPVVTTPGAPDAVSRPRVPLQLVYAGTFSPRRNTLEMTGLPAALAARGVPAELHMVGDVADRGPSDWGRRMVKALEDTPDVVWHGGRSRAETLELAARCDVALAWRHPDLDAALEPSLKTLEPGALGLPVVLNHTPAHEELFGADYPLYSGPGLDSVVDALARAADPGTHRAAAQRSAAVSAPFTLDQAVALLRSYLSLAFPSAPRGTNPRLPLKVVVAGHELKYLTRLVEHLDALPGIEVRVDEWEGLRTHDQYRSRELAAWADVVVCEWCGPNALFYARHKRDGQRLLVRLHRFELSTEWPRRLDIEKVDAVVCVSPHYAALARERASWPADKVVSLPSGVDVAQLSRPKLPGARYTLGMIGVAPSRKRVDRALDVLADLRRRDPRYTLAVKTRQPWDYWWVWNRPEERDYYERAYRRIQRSETLADGVVFDPYGPDVAVWLRRVGFVLSTSDDESFHLGPAEGAASGSVPAVLDWPGADTVYSRRWVHESPGAMADAVHAVVTGGRFDAVRAEARAEIAENYSMPRVLDAWTRLIVTGDRPEPVRPESGGPAG